MANPALWGFGLAAVGLIAAGVWLKLDEGQPPGTAAVRPLQPVPVVTPAEPVPANPTPSPDSRVVPSAAQPPADQSPLPPKPEREAAPVGDQGAASDPAGDPRPARAVLGADPGGTLPRLVTTLRGWGREAATAADPTPPGSQP